MGIISWGTNGVPERPSPSPTREDRVVIKDPTLTIPIVELEGKIVRWTGHIEALGEETQWLRVKSVDMNDIEKPIVSIERGGEGRHGWLISPYRDTIEDKQKPVPLDLPPSNGRTTVSNHALALPSDSPSPGHEAALVLQISSRA